MELRKKIIQIIISSILILLLSCSTYKYVMNNQFDGYYYKNQVDSICITEGIPFIHSGNWVNTNYIDYETNNRIDQYFYIIDMDTIQFTYTVTDLDSLYRFKKRITRKIK